MRPDFSALWKNEPGMPAGFWLHDEGGSLNAVYGLLRSLGVRWFMPGELGEVVPKKEMIAVGPLGETVKPDYPVRDWNWYNFAGFAYDDIIWARRLGMNSCDELLGPNTGPHGLVHVLSAPAMQKAHPEYYALIGGKRDTTHRERGTPCFNSSELAAETVRYIRFMFDAYDLLGRFRFAPRRTQSAAAIETAVQGVRQESNLPPRVETETTSAAHVPSVLSSPLATAWRD